MQNKKDNKQVVVNQLTVAKSLLNNEDYIDDKYDDYSLDDIAEYQVHQFKKILKYHQQLDHSPFPYNYSLRRNGIDEVNAVALLRSETLLDKLYKCYQKGNQHASIKYYLDRNKDINFYFSKKNLYHYNFHQLKNLLDKELSKYLSTFQKQHKFKYYLLYQKNLEKEF